MKRQHHLGNIVTLAANRSSPFLVVQESPSSPTLAVQISAATEDSPNVSTESISNTPIVVSPTLSTRSELTPPRPGFRLTETSLSVPAGVTQTKASLHQHQQPLTVPLAADLPDYNAEFPPLPRYYKEFLPNPSIGFLKNK